MTDILKCHGMTEDGAPCPKRRECYRFKSPANEFGQSFVVTKWSYKNGCRYLMRERPVANGLNEHELWLGYGAKP